MSETPPVRGLVVGLIAPGLFLVALGLGAALLGVLAEPGRHGFAPLFFNLVSLFLLALGALLVGAGAVLARRRAGPPAARVVSRSR